ncbi:MAG: phosphoribosylformylglycinamidine cyclo-ligase [Candidatus Omnitrophota bacterium]|nr:phosphoribosylformylglycinamidine cyclo-ligase [Candidatus Omnitrophota bacterium]
MKKITYKKSGVDIKRAGIFKAKIKPMVRKSFRKEVLKDIGGFGSFFELAKGKYKEPVLVSSSDGVGTKLKIAVLADKHDTVGIDAVAMNVNDILCTGAEPLFFLDYLAYSQLKEKILVDIINGINDGCVESGCSLIGGETAQMPGMYKAGEYDIAGFCVGAIEKKNIIDGSRIKPGNLIIGLESNGLHSNGFSLVRKVFSQSELKRHSKELLKPTRIYVKPVLSLLRNTQYAIHGISHITGGAFHDKIARILPKNVNALIYKDCWPIPQIFQLIQKKGNIADKEMFNTFNMGVGMVLMVEPKAAKAIIMSLRKSKLKAGVIGEIVKGKRRVEII